MTAMRFCRKLAWVFLVVIACVSAGAEFTAPAGYRQQHRDSPGEPPSRRFLLGTDDLGRDRFARLVYGIRTSLLLAPATALLATAIALTLAISAAWTGGKWDAVVTTASDSMASMPLLFLLMMARAMLPLDVSEAASITVTFALLGLSGWASAVRVLRAAAINVKDSEYLKQARAIGCPRIRLLLTHSAAAIWPTLSAQFWLAVPQFVMAEANLSFLGLGVTDPMPSWGNMLGELQNYQAVIQQPWRLVPAILLVLVLGCFQILLRRREN